MGKHSTKDTRGKRPWITAVGALAVVAVAAIAFAWGNHEPADPIAGGGGGNTGNVVTVD